MGAGRAHAVSIESNPRIAGRYGNLFQFPAVDGIEYVQRILEDVAPVADLQRMVLNAQRYRACVSERFLTDGIKGIIHEFALEVLRQRAQPADKGELSVGRRNPTQPRMDIVPIYQTTCIAIRFQIIVF